MASKELGSKVLTKVPCILALDLKSNLGNRSTTPLQQQAQSTRIESSSTLRKRRQRKNI